MSRPPWTPERRAKFAATMLRKYGTPEERRQRALERALERASRPRQPRRTLPSEVARLEALIADLERRIFALEQRSTVFTPNHRRIADGGTSVREQRRAARA